jgi:hypothetical protein
MDGERTRSEIDENDSSKFAAWSPSNRYRVSMNLSCIGADGYARET